MLKVLGSNVLVEPDKDWGLQGGIMLPDDSSPVTMGTVRAVGPGPRYEDGTHKPLPIKVGDHVIFREYYSTEFYDCRFITFDQLDCVYTDKKVTALNDRVIITDWKEQEELIQSAATKPFTGIVYDAGPDTQLKKGDEVLFARWSAMPYSINNEFPFLIIRQGYIYGVQ